MPIKGYRHLTLELRCQIFALKGRGISQDSISKQLGVDKYTISREFKRNKSKDGCYDAVTAQLNYQERQVSARKSRVRKLSGDTLKQVSTWLTDYQWSPSEISGRLKKEFGIQLSQELIYQYIWRDKHAGGELYKHLRRRGKKYQNRAQKYAGRGYIPNRVDIKERPFIVQEKGRLGDWEVDLIEGGKGDHFMLTLTERKTQLMLMKKLPNKTAKETSIAIIELLLPYKKHVHSITSDNGKEFMAHEYVQRRLETLFFFATPYHSWERGLNGRTNVW
jgi:IS30 family transposase